MDWGVVASTYFSTEILRRETIHHRDVRLAARNFMKKM